MRAPIFSRASTTGPHDVSCHFRSKDSLIGRNPPSSGCVCAHPTLPREPLRGRVTCGPVELALENMGARMCDRTCPCVLSRSSGSYNLIIFYDLTLSLVICPFPAILFSWGAPSIITQPFFQVFSDMFEVLCGTPMVYSITSAISLWYFC
jgi:hypothetical protein